MAVKNFMSLLTDTWMPEVISATLSLVSWAVNVILLFIFDGESLFDRDHVTLNTLISIFSTASRVLLLFAVSSALGQWKYISLAQKEMKMIEFQNLDDASRGVTGSVFLLWSTKLRSLAGLGAVVMILSLAIDPFAQSIIDISSRNVRSAANPASVSQAKRYSLGLDIVNWNFTQTFDGDTPVYNLTSTPDFSMQSSILAGLSGATSTISDHAEFQCPSSQCEWGPFQSLGVCSKCNDVTSSLNVTDPPSGFNSLQNDKALSYTPLYDWTNWGASVSRLVAPRKVTWIQLPNGLFMDGYPSLPSVIPAEQVAMVSLGTTNRSQSVSFQDLDTMLYSMSFIRVPNGMNVTENFPNVSVDATECALYYCVNEYSSHAVNGTLQESVREVSHDQTADSWQAVNQSISPSYHPTSLMQSIYFPRTDLELVGSYRMSQEAINGIGSLISETMEETISLNDVAIPSVVNGYYISSLSGDSYQFGPNAMKPLYDSTDLNETFTQLASSMSNSIRSNADNGTVVYGKIQVTVYKVHWPWIALPILECIGACAFLALTILKSRQLQTPLWKSSSLAVLACGASVDEGLRGASSVSEMEAVAGQRNMSLLNSGKGGAAYTSTDPDGRSDIELRPLSRAS
ncbi:hypothetical protein HDK64DRAFT_251005 [Phyllosticta capitalensis]